ncbi:hypothetical protein [Ventosimonas gracilis]|nr:hypothetical protein [Ventosimonas gracilis]
MSSHQRACQYDAKRHFIANQLAHELEALLLAKPDAFSLWMDRKIEK